MSVRGRLHRAAEPIAVRVRRVRTLWRWTADTVPPPAAAFAAFGPASAIAHPARVERPECIRIGDQVLVLDHVWFRLGPGTGAARPELRIDDGCRMNRFVTIECHGRVHLGRGVLVADRAFISDVEVLPGDERTPPGSRLAEPAPVVIEEGVFIGAGAVIKPGVTIGRFAYVSASSVVTKDVPERALVTGSPARVVRTWTPEEGPPA